MQSARIQLLLFISFCLPERIIVQKTIKVQILNLVCVWRFILSCVLKTVIPLYETFHSSLFVSVNKALSKFQNLGWQFLSISVPKVKVTAVPPKTAEATVTARQRPPRVTRNRLCLQVFAFSVQTPQSLDGLCARAPLFSSLSFIHYSSLTSVHSRLIALHSLPHFVLSISHYR